MTTPNPLGAGPVAGDHEPQDDSRRARGMTVLTDIGDVDGLDVLEGLRSFAPRLAGHIVDYAFGDVYSSSALDPDQRQLVTIGALTALGGCEPQLAIHVGVALNVGVQPDEIIEAVTHAAVFCGFPRALNAIGVVRGVLEARGVLPDHDSDEPAPREVEHPTSVPAEAHTSSSTGDRLV